MNTAPQRSQTFHRRQWGWMLVFVLSYLGVAQILTTYSPPTPLTLVILLLPLAPLVGVLVSVLRHYQQEPDELEQRIALLAMTLTTGLLLLVATFWGFCVRFLGAPAFPLDLSMAVVALVWSGVRLALWWHYR